MISDELIKEANSLGLYPGIEVRVPCRTGFNSNNFILPEYDKWREDYNDIAWYTENGATHGYCWIRRAGIWSVPVVKVKIKIEDIASDLKEILEL